jgi:hypothetical protein
MSHDTPKLLLGERVLWEGRPEWGGLANDLFRLRWIAVYLAICLIFGLHNARAAGMSPLASVTTSLPFVLLSLALLGGCAAFAWGIARSTRYIITNQRCVMSFGLALTGTLSLPLARVAQIAVSCSRAESGDIALALKPGRKPSFVKLWPHARAWRLANAQPMLRSVPHAQRIAALLAAATAAVSPGRLAEPPERRLFPLR